MKTIYNKIASILAFVIGAMAITSGLQVLLGKDPGYYVLNWLPVYNYSIGLLTVFITAILIWRNSKLSLPLAITTISLHAIVMLSLQTGFRDVVAAESIKAMTIRLITWGIILTLMVIQSYKNKVIQKAPATT